MEAKLLTQHPEGKRGVNISKEKYDLVRGAIERTLLDAPLTFTELAERVGAALRGRFDGSIDWYVETVKLDMEAKRVIERTGSKPQRYRLAGA